MAFDGLLLRGVVQELQVCVGGRIGKIHQPTKQDLVMNIRSKGDNHKLLLSANPTYPRIHLTPRSFLNPKEAPMFCMLMRKHFENGIIEAIEQVDLERIIIIRVRKQDEIGDTGNKTLIMELMGRHSNLIIVDPLTEQVIDSIHHVTPAISSFRTVLPGFSYASPPEQGKLNPLQLDYAQFSEAMKDEEEDLTVQLQPEQLEPERFQAEQTTANPPLPIAPDKRIMQRISGISPLLARELVYRATQSEDSEDNGEQIEVKLWDQLSKLLQSIQEQRIQPNIVHIKGKEFFSFTPLTHLEGEVQSFDLLQDCLEAFYGDKANKDSVKQRTTDLHRFLQNELNKNVNKMDKLEETLKEGEGADRHRITGELLTASMHLMSKGDTKVNVINYYDENQSTLTINLDPLLTPSENVQRYFKRYTKAKNSVIAVQEQMESTRAEITYLSSLLQQLQNAEMKDIEEIREELIEQGYIRDRGKKGKKPKKKELPRPAQFTSSEGIPIYVGKNNTQNDYVTNKLARANDTWLHTKDIPGSHVVIRSDQFGQATLDEAAQFAAYFSQARESSRVPVDYTLIRHVRKPNGAKPGYVIYDQQKTLYVTPDPQLIKKFIVQDQ